MPRHENSQKRETSSAPAGPGYHAWYAKEVKKMRKRSLRHFALAACTLFWTPVPLSGECHRTRFSRLPTPELLRGGGVSSPWAGDIQHVGGAGGVDGRPGMMVRHPFGHGGFTRARLSADLVSCADGHSAGTTALSLAINRYARKFSAGQFAGWSEQTRRAMWHAAAWEHALQEMRRYQDDDETYRLMLKSDQFRAEGERRLQANLKEIGSLIPADCILSSDHEGDESYIGPEPFIKNDAWVPWGIDDTYGAIGGHEGGYDGGEEEEHAQEEHAEEEQAEKRQHHNLLVLNNSSLSAVSCQNTRKAKVDKRLFGRGVYFFKYSQGLYYNVTGGRWYDTRTPRRFPLSPARLRVNVCVRGVCGHACVHVCVCMYARTRACIRESSHRSHYRHMNSWNRC